MKIKTIDAYFTFFGLLLQKKITYVSSISSEKLFDMCPIYEYYIIFIYFQAAVSALLAVSVLYVEKNQNKDYVIFGDS